MKIYLNFVKNIGLVFYIGIKTIVNSKLMFDILKITLFLSSGMKEK